MPYYPKSQIKTNLFARSGDYIIKENGDIYVGSYYELSTGEKFTGKFPGDGSNREIVFNPNNLDLVDANRLNPNIMAPPLKNIIKTPTPQLNPTNINITPNRSIPINTYPTPTEKDYTTGTFTRYFAKKNNEPKFIEINKNQYDQFKSQDPSVALELYSVQPLLWTIIGDVNQVYKANRHNAKRLEQTQKWYGFPSYFKDNFTKYLK